MNGNERERENVETEKREEKGKRKEQKDDGERGREEEGGRMANESEAELSMIELSWASTGCQQIFKLLLCSTSVWSCSDPTV